jgi:arylsulfatase A-like enzyme
MEAHLPYSIPPGVSPRFSSASRREAQLELLRHWKGIDKLTVSVSDLDLAFDAYDDCLAYLDARIGELCEELQRRGILDQTLLVITADHGESFGEHGQFMHGESLYSSETHVPLLIVPPGGRHRTVEIETVSLRDLPATIVDLVGLAAESPFPGRSLARIRADSPDHERMVNPDGVMSELSSPNPSRPNQRRSPAHRGPLFSLAEGEYLYIRNEGDGSEELFNEREDPAEAHNLAADSIMRPVVERMRSRLDQLRPASLSRR